MQITRIREEETWASDPLLQGYLDAKAAADRANANLKVAQAKLIERMREKHMKSSAITYKGLKTTVTYVQRETFEINEEGLRKALGARQFNKYTDRKLNRKKLEEAMSAGEVDTTVVAQYTAQKVSEPYLKFSQKEVDEA